jgi:integrase
MQGFLKRSGVWHVRTDPVTGKQKSTGCRDEEAAILWRAQRERLAADPALQAAKTATVGEWVRKMLGAKEAAHKTGTISAGGLQSIRSKLAQVVRVLGAERALSTVDTNAIDSYIETRRGECGHGEKRVGDYTIAREIRSLLAVLQHAKRRGCFPGDIQALQPDDLEGSYTPRERSLSEDEVVRLTLAMPTQRWASVVAICVALGCRISEALRLAPEDIDLDAGIVWIDGRKTEGANRTLPIISSYRGMLEAAIPALPIGKLSNFDRTFKLACGRAGIEMCSPNDLRRTHSTLLGARGIPDDMVARLLGHKTTTLAKRTYNRVKAMQLAPVAERILATAEPLLLPGESVQISDSDRRKSRKHGKYDDELRPPEPKVEGSNLSWRTENSENGELNDCSNGHQVASSCAVTHTYSRQWTVDRSGSVPGQIPPSCRQHPDSDRLYTRLETEQDLHPLSPAECVAHGLRHSSQDDHGDLVGGQYARTPEAIRALAGDAMLRGLSRRLPSSSSITTEAAP